MSSSSSPTSRNCSSAASQAAAYLKLRSTAPCRKALSALATSPVASAAVDPTAAASSLAVEAVSARRGSQRRTRAEVIIAARRAAANLRAKGVGAGQRVVLIGTHHIDFYGAWLGAVWLGAVPCVLAEPSVRMDRTEYELRLTTLLQRIGAKALLWGAVLVLAGLPLYFWRKRQA